MIKLTINDHDVEVLEGSTVLQAVQALNIEVPIFCYHERLSIAGNCRMCLVQLGTSPKPIASCAMPASEGMVIRTDTPMVEKARKGVLEFLLINHPLDCPICDQGGECDLQDITMGYGREKSRFNFYKRAVPNKNLGPLVKTEMTRCIHCTRCVRFVTEVAGVPEMGAIHRGEHTEITSYLEKALTSELSGNIIDLCPVGALTSKPYAFKGRPWELVKTESVDVLDALGSNIRIDSRGREVMRILPRLNEEVNEEWLSDKSRFSYDGLKYQRLDRPYVRDETGKLVPATWDQAFDRVAQRLKKLKGSQIAAIVGDLVDAESMGVLKDLMAVLKSPHIDCRQDGMKLSAAPRCSYLFNTTLQGVEQADFCLLVGTNPRLEAPVLNARLRKVYVATGLPIAAIGPQADFTYPTTFYGNDPALLQKISAEHPLQQAFQAARNPMLILGSTALRRPDSQAILFAAWAFVEAANGVRPDWNGFNVLHTAASRVGGLDLGLVPGRDGLDVEGILKACETQDIQAVYLLGADEIDTERLKQTFVVYQGHHGDRGAQIADVIFPGAAYTEKDGLYVNTEGRVQRGYMACVPPGEAKEDWKILRMLAQRLGLSLPSPLQTLEEVRARLAQINPLFQQVDMLTPAPWEAFGKKGEILSTGFSFPEPQEFYMTNAISRHSLTMATCAKTRQERQEEEHQHAV